MEIYELNCADGTVLKVDSLNKLLRLMNSITNDDEKYTRLTPIKIIRKEK